MSNFTDYAENKFADWVRGQGLTLPTNWYFALGSAASDSSFTELSGTSYARVAVARSLANFAGTQAAGSTLASSGTSHQSSNNAAITWPTAGSGGWGSRSKVGMFDASTGGNCWAWIDVSALTINNGDTPSIAAAGFALTLGITGGMTDYLANKAIDLFLRAQAFTYPATQYGRLFTVAPTNAGGGTECIGASYARPSIAGSLTAWSGTQSAGSTAASSGTGGRISNNATLAFPAPLENQGDALAFGLQDAASSGNLLWWKAMSPVSILAGGSPAQFAADALGIKFA